MRDKTKHTIPKELEDCYDAASARFAGLLNHLQEAYDTLARAGKDKDPLFWELHDSYKDIIDTLHGVMAMLSKFAPYAVCGMCQGREEVNCALCRNHRIISIVRWHSVPKELRDMREKKGKL